MAALGLVSAAIQLKFKTSVDFVALFYVDDLQANEPAADSLGQSRVLPASGGPGAVKLQPIVKQKPSLTPAI